MMTVTEEAKSHLATVLDNAAPAEEQEESCLRIVRGENDQLAMVLDRRGESDNVVEQNGKPVLAVAPEIATMLDGRTLDIERDEQGQPALAIK